MTRLFRAFVVLALMDVAAFGQYSAAGTDSVLYAVRLASIPTVQPLKSAQTSGFPGFNSQEEGKAQANVAVDLFRQSRLLGEWNGTRNNMSDAGFELGLSFKCDNFVNLAGGVRLDGSYMHNFDALFAIDGEKLLGWTGGSLLAHFISNNGGSLSKIVGDAQYASNIEAPGLTKLYELWIQQSFSFASFSVLAGLYDLNREFYVTKASGLFLNSSHGIGKEVSQTGKNGPSVFPNTALACRFKFRPAPDLYVQAAALDGVPGRKDDPCASSFMLSSEEGALIAAEAGYSREETDVDHSYAKLAIGAWTYTSPFDVLLPGSNDEQLQSRGNSGVYFLAEDKILSPTSSSPRGLAVFARGGLANSRINKFDYHFGVGAVYVGLIDGREEDVLGIALARAHTSTDYRQLMFDQGYRILTGELSVELTYRAQVTPWLAVQPNVQHIVHPSADASLASATVLGGRLEVAF